MVCQQHGLPVVVSPFVVRRRAARSKRWAQCWHDQNVLPRQFGACFLGLELWKRLGLDRFFEQAIDGSKPADVPWSRVAALLAINRLCGPGSELAIEQRWYPSTALDDLLQIEEGKINDTRLYRCLDRILPHKTKLERHLKDRYVERLIAQRDSLLQLYAKEPQAIDAITRSYERHFDDVAFWFFACSSFTTCFTFGT